MRPTRVGAAILSAAVITATFALMMRGADAHHPEVTASAVCADGQSIVTIRATSWETDEAPRRHNNDVVVTFDAVVVGRGVFVPSNQYSFEIPYRTATDGATHTVRAAAVAPFGPQGEFGDAGSFRETTVTTPSNCSPAAAPTTTIASTSTTVPVAPGAPGGTTGTSTTLPSAPGTGAGTVTAPTPTVVVDVLGAAESRTGNAAAVPVEVLPRFAG